MDVAAEDLQDVTHHLADMLGLEIGRFADLFGAGWRPSAEPFDVTGWHLSGEPVQLMIRVFENGVFLARPEGVWRHGTSRLSYRECDQVYVARQGFTEPARIAELIRSLVGPRRHSFRYCRFCRELHAPEELWEADVCRACAVEWFAVTS